MSETRLPEFRKNQLNYTTWIIIELPKSDSELELQRAVLTTGPKHRILTTRYTIDCIFTERNGCGHYSKRAVIYGTKQNTYRLAHFSEKYPEYRAEGYNAENIGAVVVFADQLHGLYGRTVVVCWQMSNNVKSVGALFKCRRAIKSNLLD